MQSKPHEILVEDHADSADLLAQVLHPIGRRMHTTGTCAEARELLRELAAVRRVPAIVITGYGQPKDLDAVEGGGVRHARHQAAGAVGSEGCAGGIRLNGG
jgi:hypothetical protein